MTFTSQCRQCFFLRTKHDLDYLYSFIWLSSLKVKHLQIHINYIFYYFSIKRPLIAPPPTHPQTNILHSQYGVQQVAQEEMCEELDTVASLPPVTASISRDEQQVKMMPANPTAPINNRPSSCCLWTWQSLIMIVLVLLLAGVGYLTLPTTSTKESPTTDKSGPTKDKSGTKEWYVTNFCLILISRATILYLSVCIYRITSKRR